MPQDSVARLSCALPLYQLKSMIHDHEVTHAGLDGTALNFKQTSTNMQRINLIHYTYSKDRRAKKEGMCNKIRNSGFIIKTCPCNKQIIFSFKIEIVYLKI